MNMLSVAAHPDDEMLVCGTILKKVKIDGYAIYTCVLCGETGAHAHGAKPLPR